MGHDFSAPRNINRSRASHSDGKVRSVHLKTLVNRFRFLVGRRLQFGVRYGF